MIRKFHTLILLVLTTALLSAQSAAGQTAVATFGGRITDENGPIEGVTVVAIHQQTNAQYYATTDRGGWWQLLDVLPGGPYTLRIHYFGYDPLTVRNLFTYAGQNTRVDADLEEKSYRVQVDEAATSMRVGPELGGGIVPVSPLGYDLVSQRIYTPVTFDVRQESPLVGTTQQWVAPTGASRFHGTAYGFYGGTIYPGEDAPSVMPGTTRHLGVGGLNVATPLGNEDYQLFAGLQYGGLSGRSGLDALSGAARFDARLSNRFRLDLSGGRLADGVYPETWAATGLTMSMLDGAGSMRLQTGWYDTGLARQMLTSDDFTFAAGRHRLLAGVQFSYQQFPTADSTSTHGDIYVQDVVRLGRKITLQGGIRFSFPFAFSPRLSLYYDLLGNGKLVLRMGTAVYGRHGEGTVWKNLVAFDTRLPLDFRLTLEGVYGQSWRRAFYISSHNVLESHYELTARLERPFADRAWALASYTHSDGSVRDRICAGFSYKMPWSQRAATSLSALYTGTSLIDDLSPASLSWDHAVEARLSQDIVFPAGSRDHTLQLTGYCRYAPSGLTSSVIPGSTSSVIPGSTRNLSFLVGLRYIL